DEADLLGVVDARPERARQVARQFGCQAWTEPTDLIGQVDAVSIAVPTGQHADVAMPFIQRGLAVLIEKPLADGLDQARRLVEAARRSGCLLQVGHTERFNPVVGAVERMSVQPKFIETHRISPFTFRSADVGVVLDLMIHDIDIVLHLVRDRPVRVEAVGVNVLGPREDIANARVAFAGGCVANLTASRLALKTERKIRVFSQQAYLSLDYQRKSGIAIKKEANLDVLKLARQHKLEDLAQMQALDFSRLVQVEPLQIDDVEPLRAELQAFLHSVRTGAVPAVSAEDGLAAMQLADHIVRSIQQHRWDGSGAGPVGLADELIRPE
ncbi:MAG: Gfo/Idh/MocA family oxidoreductase, partial [Phycisphaerae bacterium]